LRRVTERAIATSKAVSGMSVDLPANSTNGPAEYVEVACASRISPMVDNVPNRHRRHLWVRGWETLRIYQKPKEHTYPPDEPVNMCSLSAAMPLLRLRAVSGLCPATNDIAPLVPAPPTGFFVRSSFGVHF